MRKVIAILWGGLGNQMFIYASTKRLAIINNAEHVIDTISGFSHDHLYRRKFEMANLKIESRQANYFERMEPFGRYRKVVLRKINKFKSFEKRTYISQIGVDYDQRLLDLRVNKDIYIEGYWQSENYFKDIEWQIKKEFQFKTPKDTLNIEMSQLIQSTNSVAVHVRFYEQTLRQSKINSPIEYYAKSIDAMECNFPGSHYFVFSDNHKLAREKIKLPSSRTTYVDINNHENSYADLWLMSLCKNFIIANSTFSWWGAWLSQNAKKYVIAPKIIIPSLTSVASWNFEGQIPPTWNLL